MSSFVFANFINTSLAANASDSATSITVADSTGIPTLTAGQILPIEILDAATRTTHEIVYCTSITGSICTVTRAQEGTAAHTWSIGDIISCGPTAQTVPAVSLSGTTSNTFYTGGTGAVGTENDIGVRCNGFNTAFLLNKQDSWGLYSISGGLICSYQRPSNTVNIGNGLTVTATALQANISQCTGFPTASSAEAQAFSVTNKFITPATLDAAFKGANQFIGTTGTLRLGGGFYLKWITGATDTHGTESTQNLSFYSAFPNGCVASVSTHIVTASNYADAWYQIVGSATVSGCVVQRQKAGGTSVDNIDTFPFVFAIGW